jgi:hypothetical protein
LMTIPAEHHQILESMNVQATSMMPKTTKYPAAVRSPRRPVPQRQRVEYPLLLGRSRGGALPATMRTIPTRQVGT